MRVTILGAGPAGLYAALLLKLQNPAHHVTVIERNPAGATFGFGVVLSDRTLSNFRSADPVSFDAITAHQATWEAIQTFKGQGAPILCGGHTYAGIARQRLLTILQHRCEELGVHLQFETEVTDLGAFGDSDLIIAADGVNSLVRRTHAEAFGTSIERGQSKYIWLGVKWIPKAFTFIFIPTEYGLFQAHIYPYDQETSTCIVMCQDETWRNAGLDKLREASSVRFCRDLLRPFVGRRRFLANRSLWSTFQTVKNRRWSHGRIVLLGDAAHTAHWSIGSGTKLAMEDAIALVGALSRESEIEAALAAYERERRPIVERLQAAARISELACENVESAMHLDPIPFAFQLLTRSGRLDYDELRRRDPAFIEQVDRWYAPPPGERSPRWLWQYEDEDGDSSPSPPDGEQVPSTPLEAAEADDHPIAHLYWSPTEETIQPPALSPLRLDGITCPSRLVLQVPIADWEERYKAFGPFYQARPGLLLFTDLPPEAAADQEFLDWCRWVWLDTACPVALLLPEEPDESPRRIVRLAPKGAHLLEVATLPAATLNEANTIIAGGRAVLCLMATP